MHMTEPVSFALPKKPRVKEKEAPPDQRKVAVLPIRAISDQQVTDAMFRVMAAICSYCNRAGITWVGQKKLATDLGVSQQAVGKQLKKLQQAGYIEVVSQSFRAQKANTVRVIFDPTVDTATAIAITSAQEDTRPPEMKRQQNQDASVDKAGQARIAQMITKVFNSPTRKESPVSDKPETATVKKMKQEIEKAKAKRTRKAVDKSVNHEGSYTTPEVVHVDSLKVVNEGPPYTTSLTTSEVVRTQKNTVIQVSKEDSLKRFNTSLYNLSEVQLAELKSAGLSEKQVAENLSTLLAAYQAEGLTPTSDRLVAEILQLHRDAR